MSKDNSALTEQFFGVVVCTVLGIFTGIAVWIVYICARMILGWLGVMWD